MEGSAIVPILFVWALLCTAIGYIIGEGNGRPGMGALLGLCLGPIGWGLATAMEEVKKCPECMGTVPVGAKKCRHCGSELAKKEDTKAVTPPPEPADYFLWLDEKPNGPHTAAEVRAKAAALPSGMKTLCCRNGDEKWRTAEEVCL